MAGPLIAIAVQTLAPIILKELLKGDAPVHPNNAAEVAQAAAEAAAPVLVNKTNSEPWYQSRVTWGALVSIGTGLATLFGYSIAPQDAELILVIGMASGTFMGGAITLWGRWAAKKPLGQ